MWLDLTKSGFDTQSYVRRYGDFNPEVMIVL